MVGIKVEVLGLPRSQGRNGEEVCSCWLAVVAGWLAGWLATKAAARRLIDFIFATREIIHVAAPVLTVLLLACSLFFSGFLSVAVLCVVGEVLAVLIHWFR